MKNVEEPSSPPDVAGGLSDLTPEQRALLVLRMRQRAARRAPEEGQVPPLVPVPRQREMPLSFAQQRLWFADRWQPGNPAYNVPLAVRAAGRLDRAAMRWSLAEVVRRHESLRTVFAAERPVQVVRPPAPPPLPCVDLGALPAATRDAEVGRLLTAAAARPFDLARDRLLRVLLLATAPGEHVALFNTHHIVSDAWSIGVLIRDFAALYAARVAGRRSPLPELPVQYVDFAVWQREWLRGAALEAQLAYWRQRLAGAPAAIGLPLARPLPAMRSVRGGRRPYLLEPESTLALNALAQRQGATLFMLLLAGFATLLHRYSGETDLVVGSPVAGRNRAEVEGLIGFFVNTLALRCDLAGDPPLVELLERLREATVEAQAHQDLPFEKLVEELRLERDLRRPPLVQVVLSLQNTPPVDFTVPGLTLTGLGAEADTARYDLLLSANERGRRLGGFLEYSADLFDAADADRLRGHLLALLAGMAAAPRARLSRLPLLAAAERDQLLAAGAAVERFAAAPSLDRLFLAAAARRPDAVAVCCDGERLTYGELERRARRLAARLRRLGVAPEARVGLAVERSAELVVGLLAVLLAGGAYVPLDPDLPAERLAFLIADSGARLLLTRGGLLARLPPWPAERTVLLEADAAAAAGAGGEPDAGSTPAGDNAAYVLYTSGSTGRPKGVVVPHAAVARLLVAAGRCFDFGAADVWTLFHSYAFDFSVWEVWGALAHGGRLVVVPYWVSRSPDDFHRLLAAEGVTVLNQTPTAFRQLVRAGEAAGDGAAAAPPLALRWVVFGGEALEPAALAPWFARHGDRRPRLVNMYGITETTVHVTFRAVTAADVAGGSAIGAALPDLALHLLDRHLEPVPPGAVGEIHVGGAGLARGYLGRPELTAERFLPDPFAAEPGARLYRSGDLARRLRVRPRADLEFLGRADQQVKVRGFRIEPGEVEAALLAHPAVREAAVVAAGGPEGRRLVAYVVAAAGSAPAPAELRAHLLGRLPEPLVPAAFVTLDALPLTAHGKLDRGALPAPDDAARPAAGHEPPATAAEWLLAEVWEEVLAIAGAGAHDNFFALGGDSILSIRVVALARRRGLELSLQQLFRHQTLRELARHAGAAAAVDAAAAAPFGLLAAADRERLPAGVEDAYPLARLQAGMLFHSEYRPRTAVYHDVFSAHLEAPFDAARLHQAAARVTARHPVLRTAFDLASFSAPLQLVHRAVAPDLAFADLRDLAPAAQEERIAAWMEAEKGRPFDWNRPPLLRLFVHRRGEDSFQLSLSFHHAILDGWSVAALVSELLRTYLRPLRGQEEVVEEPAPEGVMRRFVALERHALDSAASRRWWEERLAGRETPRLSRWPAGGAAGRGVHSVALPPATADGLRRFARAAGVPLKSALLAAHCRVLAALSGGATAVTGLVVNGRPEEDGGERGLGLFLNTLPLHLDLAAGSWSELVARAFAAESELLAHRRFPLAELQRASGRPLFEAAFNFVHFHVYQGLAALGGLRVLGGRFFEETNFPLLASFGRDPLGDRLDLRLEHDAGEFPAAQIAAVAGLYERTLAALAAATGSERHEDAPLLSAAERHQLVHEWSGQAAAAPAAAVHVLFEEWARRAPERVALVAADGREHRYGEIDARADRLARRLLARGLSPEAPVGVALQRSVEMVVAFLAVLKAGGAYVPLDPAWPRERLALLAEEIALPLVLSAAALAPVLPAGPAVLLLDDLPSPGEGDGEAGEGTGVRAAPAAPTPTFRFSPDRLAYVLFTSGSTGRPKAVGVAHRAVVRLVRGADYARFGPDDVFLQLAPAAFDASTLEIWAPLANGGRLVVAPPGAPSLVELGQLLVRHRVTVLWLTAGLFHQMAAERLEDLRGVRQLLAGGDVLAPAAVERVLAGLPGCALVDGYGPTENTTFTCCHRVREPVPPGGTVPIGRPLAGTRVQVLDGWLRPVPAGVPGELYAGGAGLARGYLGRPDLTAERFVPDPFAGVAAPPGARLYRTGDRVRRRPDGILEFLGRLDAQVKVRGFRVEPGEVETALLAHPAVRAAAAGVVAGDGGRRLLAWVVLREPAGPEAPAALRDFLRRRLPEPMVPAAVVPLAALPLTANGKVDRRALARAGTPQPPPAPTGGDVLAAPRSPLEELLAAIWCEVMGLPRVEPGDDFFALGGHSLLATQVVSRVRSAFGVELPLAALFAAPTVAGLARAVADARRAHEGWAPPPLVAAPRGRELPLSFAQERLWFLERLQPGTAAYNLPLALRLAGRLDAAALAASLDAIVARHEALRTRFPTADGRPVQAVDPARPGALSRIDLAALPPARRAAEAGALLARESLRPFDLAAGPPLRALLLRLAPAEHAALLALHHIAADGWSLGVLVRELTALYTAFVAGGRAALPDLPVQYADFAVWQRGWLSGEVLAAELAFWRERLAGAPPLLALPLDRPRPPVQSYRGGSRREAVDTGTAAALRSLARGAGVTLFMALLAVLDALLHRVSGQPQVVVGVPSANRNRTEIEGLIGFFVNTLALAADLAADPPFAGLLAAVRESTLAAFAHQDLPFEKLVAELNPQRDLSHAPLFQVLAQLQNVPRSALELPGLILSLPAVESGTSKFDLALTFVEVEARIAAEWRYNAELFDAPTVARLAGQFATLLRGALASPARRLSELPLLSEIERHQLVREWNATAEPVAEAGVADLFAAQAVRTPDAVAVAHGETSVSYGELAARVERVARRLTADGAGAESLVALLAGRGPDLVAATLAVLRAGAAFLPLDPAQPEKRLRRVLERSGAGWVVTGVGAPPAAPADCWVLDLAELLEPLPPSPGGEGGEGSSDSLAYVIYTSGSTGVPKGVMLTARGLGNHLRAKISDLGLSARDVVAQTASQAFDISIWQSLAALLAGGRVQVVEDAAARDPARLLETVERAGITVLELVPSLLAGVLAVLPEPLPALASLRWLVATGEALAPALARRWLALYPGVGLLDAYGPTEAADRVSHHRVREVPAAAAAVPIGRPIANLRLHVVDGLAAGLQPAPIGVLGELCAGGAGVGRGYRDEPARTAEAFVPDPFGAAGERLYRTGDLARLLADGRIEFLGRRDQQVKVRGHRIELGEIEAALAGLREVKEAAAAVRGGRLVAYVVARREEAADEELLPALRAALAEELPAALVPSAFVRLGGLPRTANGKLDRRALPEPAAPAATPAAPRTPLERLLAGMWQEVLGPVAVGVHDSFFELGGDSIKGAIFVNRLERRLGEGVPVAALFETPSVAALAARLEESFPAAAARLAADGEGEEGSAAGLAERWLRAEAGPAVADPRLAPLARRGWAPGEAPLSYAQERLWFLQRLEPATAAYNMPQAFRLRGALDAAALARSFAEILRRHEALRTRFATLEARDGGAAPVVSPVPDAVLPRVDLGDLPAAAREREARRLVAAEALRPFDLARGPVVRSVLLGLGAEEHVLAFTSHHIACDGWSMGLWAREMMALYAAFTAGRPSPLPDPPVQYADFAHWQRGWLQGRALAAQVAYWRERLRDLPPALDLPADHPRPPIQSFRGESAALGLVPELADALRGLAGRHNASPFMVLLAGFVLLLRRLSGQEDVAVGSPIAGRTRPEVEGLIGCFLNTLVLRLDVAGDPPFPELLRRVRETALGAFSYQDVPFEKLLEELRPERDLSRASLFQVLFNMLNAPSAELALPGLEMAGLPMPEVLAKFDLTLYVAEWGEGHVLRLVYNADLFARPRMEEMLRQYLGLLEQIAAAPEGPLGSFSLLTPAAAAALPDPAASLDHPWPGPVADLFAAWAERAPARPAVVDRRGTWSYGALDAAASRLAARLHADGVGRGDVVALYAHRGAPLVAALYGVLRAGAAFTILDPAYPAPQLVARLDLAAPRGFVHLAAAGPLPPALAGFVAAAPLRSRLALPEGGAEGVAAAIPAAPLPESWLRMEPYDLASIAFTSGSTGVPKGIRQSHGSMSYFLPWHQEELGYSAAERCTLLSGLAHDPVHRDVFYTLGLGGVVCVPDPDAIGAPGYLAAWMREQRITVTNLTPAMGLLLAELPPGAPEPELPDLRAVVLAGDVLTRLDVARLSRLAPRARFWNVYGTTESQRALSFHAVEEDGGRRRKQVLPLGRGKRGCQLLVLAPGGQRAGVGELGEVAIRSPHLALGYLKDEALTRARFVANPFTGLETDRLYRTGDLGRYLPNGEVEAAGRADQQVKIRGFRVEPGEVESELGRLAGVREAVVMAREVAGERRLVAYLVLAREAPPAVAALRETLRQQLPSHLVPSVWVVLDRLPVNPNGKVDRLALPPPEASTAGRPAAVPPRDDLEERLLRIWEEVLGSPAGAMGVTDDFFDLGGHSLLAVRLMAKIASELGEELPLAALFQGATVAELAASLRDRRAPRAGSEGALVALAAPETEARRPPLFLVHPAGGQVFCYRELARLLSLDRPVYGLQDAAPAAAERSLAGLAARYLEEVLAAAPAGPYLLAGWSFGGRVAFEMARQLAAAGREVAFLGMIDTGLVEPPARDGQSDAELLREALVHLPAELLADLGPETADPVAAVVERAKRAGLLPDDYDPAAAHRHLERFKAHLAVARRDRPSPYPGRVDFFAAQELLPGTVAPAAAGPAHGWEALAGSLEVHPVPGDHVSLLADPDHRRVLAERLAAALRRA
jgi:amino acid adenylation domain-containing protein